MSYLGSRVVVVRVLRALACVHMMVYTAYMLAGTTRRHMIHANDSGAFTFLVPFELGLTVA